MSYLTFIQASKHILRYASHVLSSSRNNLYLAYVNKLNYRIYLKLLQLHYLF